MQSPWNLFEILGILFKDSFKEFAAFFQTYPLLSLWSTQRDNKGYGKVIILGVEYNIF